MKHLNHIIVMSGGNVLIGAGVTGLRLSLFGTDPYTCMNLGICSFVHMSFGTWQLITNILLLIFVLFSARDKIGLGTLVNMTLVGYLSDFLCWGILDLLQWDLSLPVRMAALVTGLIVLSLGCAMYMEADLGIAPYDALAMILADRSHGRIPFQAMRIVSDCTVLVTGLFFGILAGTPLGSLAGIGTVLSALCMGPLISWFRIRLFAGHGHPAAHPARDHL